MSSSFKSNFSALSSPGENAFAVTPSDVDNFPISARAVYVGGTGDASVITVGGDTVTFVGLPTGSILPVRVIRVNATGTTASDLVAIY